MNGYEVTSSKHSDGDGPKRAQQAQHTDGNTAPASSSSATGSYSTTSCTSTPLRQRLPSQAGLSDLSSANPGIFVGGIGGSNIYCNNIQTPSTFNSSNLGVNYSSVAGPSAASGGNISSSGGTGVTGTATGPVGGSGATGSGDCGIVGTAAAGGATATGASSGSASASTPSAGGGGGGVASVPRRQGSFTNVFSKIIDGMPAGTMFSKFKNVSTPVVQQTVIDGNPIKQYFDIGKQVACAGPELAWKIHEGHRKNDGKVG